MKRNIWSRIVASVCVGGLWIWGGKVWAFQRAIREHLPDFDIRQSASPASNSVPAAREAAAARLRGGKTDVRVDFDAVTGSPKWVAATDGFLTWVNGNGLSVAARAAVTAQDPHGV